MASTFLATTLLASAQPAWVNDGLVAYYPFNGDAEDQSGSGNHLRNQGSILVDDRFSSGNSAARFDGDSYLWAPDSVLPAKNSPRSISIWVKADGDLFTLIESSTGIETQTGLVMSYGNLPVIVGRGGVWIEIWNDIASGTGIRYVSKSSESTGVFLHSERSARREDWHHVCYTFDGQTLSYFYNGILANTKESQEFHDERASRLYIGGWPDAGGKGLVGAIDDVRIYDRALSAGEVKELHAFESGLLSFEEELGEALVAYYPFEGDSTDAGGSGLDGVMTGGDFDWVRWGALLFSMEWTITLRPLNSCFTLWLCGCLLAILMRGIMYIFTMEEVSLQFLVVLVVADFYTAQAVCIQGGTR
ncbi:LamG domain-containing protein [bacterium]|nr:LamG domain-containing protein [bacterium]